MSLKHTEEDTDGSKEDDSGKGSGELFEVDSDPAKVFETIEETFDDITKLVELNIMGSLF